MTETVPEQDQPIQNEVKIEPQPGNEDLKTLKDNAYKSFESSYHIQRFQRLNFLIEQTALYSNFLSQKLVDHTQERAKLLEENPDLGDYVQSNDQTKKRTRRPRNAAKNGNKNAKTETPLALPNGQPSLLTGACLREYQLQGMEWLISLYENGLNGILADEMGLGKTIQTIALISYLVEKRVKGPFIIVAPLSTIANWINEFTRFTPSLEVILYYGTKDERKMIRQQSLLSPKSLYPIIITSYEVAMSDRRALQNINWKYMVVDECQRIKNFNCKLVNDLKKYNTDNRLLLTGTPLQNNLNELWSLLNFLLPDVFNDMDSFVDWFDFSDLRQEGGDELILDKEKEKSIISKLHHILKPFLLRRVKADVEKLLPKKREYILYANLTEPQRILYEASVKRTTRDYLMNKGKEAGANASQIKVYKNTSTMNIAMQCRKICNHPALCDMKVNPETKEIIYDLDTLVSDSGKMMLLDRLLDDLLPKGHRVLIFSQMTTMLDILANYLIDIKNIDCFRIDGGVQQEDRRDMIDRFQNDPSVQVFLLSTRAGGLGINLTGADTCILFDSDWNPQMDLQAQDRCHRIGQTKPVIIYRLITANTVEAHMIKTASSKRKLEKLVIHRNKFRGLGNVSSISNASYIQELEQMLKSQEYEKVIIKPGDEVMSEEDMQRITDRSEAAYQTEISAKDGAFEIYETKFEENSFVMNPEDPTYLSPDDSDEKTEEIDLEKMNVPLDEDDDIDGDVDGDEA